MWLGHGTETSVRRLGASWAQRTSTTILTTTQRRFVLGIEAWQGWFPTYRSRQCMFQEKAEKRKIKTTLNKSRTTTPLQISVLGCLSVNSGKRITKTERASPSLPT
ncbi:hypothetical protein COCVIDRAFT_18955 [Bipolaris victoriae FI3]|uniref:Uncharacterized protein n=1 Tax=Bipolaris victoriae (strain FI3) TaxID=930091 RepID=W7EH05_BIPV3|nr:hypothetical protein COCVIDRAFT_18955 [Bipolaris victoriae FI3]